MKFEFTPEEAQPVAEAIAKHLRKRGFKTAFEKPLSADAPFRTALLAKKSALIILVDAQGAPSYEGSLRGLATWLFARRAYCELHVGTHEDATIPGRMLRDLKHDGVGLLLVDGKGGVHSSLQAVNPALTVTPDPTLALGDKKKQVKELVDRFNRGERKDALRDMCELVEGTTEAVALAACRKSVLKVPKGNVEAMDWNSQINVLASKTQHQAGATLCIEQAFKDDLHSFRGARNLLDHKVKNKREEARRQRQFAERMMMGPRLVSELLSIKRRLG